MANHAGRKQHGFPRRARLLKHAAFDRVYQQGRRFFLGNLTVFFRRREAGETPGGPRVGFTVGRALGGAVERNRLKRRLREAVRHHLSALEGPVDVVFNPKRSVASIEFVLLSHEVRRAFEQVTQRTANTAAASAPPRAERRQA